MSKSQWFYDLWNRSDTRIMMIRPNMKFVKPNGDANSIFMPIVLAAIGIQGQLALSKSGLGNVR
jgi:hypothetical protein